MHIQEPLPLYHSWPLFEAPERFAVGGLLPPDRLPSPAALTPVEDMLAARGIGVWECNLADNALLWTSGVYDLFGLPRGVVIERALSVSLYRPDSRRAMETLRAHTIRYKRGFTVDAELRGADGGERWMRLSAVPVLDNGKVVRLCGVKIDVTAEYDMQGPVA
ncbi:MAG TPA: PAS domain-containing protein [Sphingobium sp.]|uniref:PAS domain-containing protein n=1 Tax=Sphingobium sp. TaxID=1912891 RepID=UPI002ED61FB7